MTIDLSSVNAQVPPLVQSYTWRDVALYAIGLGASVNDLDYLLDDPPPRVLPTYSVIPAFAPVFEALKLTGGNLVTLLHSGQRTELIQPFPPEGEMKTTAAIRGIWDMKIGALTIIDSETHVNGELTARTAWHLLLRGEGKFGGPRAPKLLMVKPPSEAAPDFEVRSAHGGEPGPVVPAQRGHKPYSRAAGRGKTGRL